MTQINTFKWTLAKLVLAVTMIWMAFSVDSTTYTVGILSALTVLVILLDKLQKIRA